MPGLLMMRGDDEGVTERRGVCAIKLKPFLVVSNRALFSHSSNYFSSAHFHRTHTRSAAACALQIGFASHRRSASAQFHCMTFAFARASSLHHGAIFVRFHRKK